MQTIYKFDIFNTVRVPKSAKLLKIGYQEKFVAWYELDTDDKEYRCDSYSIVGTGWELHNLQSMIYIDTIFEADYVWHVYKNNNG
jgi:hypothetical protein